MSSDGEYSGMNNLPPHIAARFNRSSKSRRKSSAASSRRNSMTSLRSNQSNRSAHGGPQSTHIAQHLRRASIIESRKARLADKAAHAEKVRLRAALAKAAPRVTANREDRALAAQQARERYLAQVAANCAEEVKRAKKVAEDMKEKKAAEHLKLKGDIEEKFAEAERRRLLYQQNSRRSRFTSLPAVEEKKITISPWKPRNEEAAARLLQKAWRNRRKRRIVSQYLSLNLTVEDMRRENFEEFSSRIAQEHVLRCTTQLLELCGIPDDEAAAFGVGSSARMFLSAFLVVGYPPYVFSQNGEQEQDLGRKAVRLLICFGLLVSPEHTGRNFSPRPTQTADLIEAFADFGTAFNAWKNQDSSVLVETMIAHFVELDAIWQTVKNDTAGHVADDYREGIQKNQTLLLVRLKRLAGPEKALELVREAIQARRKLKSKVKNRLTHDIVPREVSGAVDPVDGPENPNATPSPLESVPKSPIGASDIRKVISSLPNNRAIVHELAVNKDYRIEDSSNTHLRRNINRIIFSRMRRDLQEGKGDQWIISMAQTIRDRLLRVVTPGKSLHVLISETLDIDLIKNQLTIGSFSYEKFFSFMNTILPKLCAPIRDPQVKALAADTSEDLIGRLEKLMDIINFLSLDYANYQLRLVSSGITDRSAEYEKRCFNDQYQGKRLTKTIRWWRSARTRLIVEASRRAPQTSNSTTIHSSSNPPRPASDKIYTRGLVDLFITLPPTTLADIPETLDLDTNRIARIRNDILRLITISTILLTAKNLLKRDVRSHWKVEAQRMWDLPSAYTEALPYLAIVESAHAMPPATRTSLLGTIERVLGDARKPQQMSQPVMKVLLQKLRAHVMARLGAASSEERLRSASTASEVLGNGGMAEWVGRVGALVEELGMVKGVDWAGHGAWIDGVAAEVERLGDGVGGTA